MVVWNPGSALFYYKMVQESKTIQAFVDIVTSQSETLAKRLENVTSIVIHFSLKIGEWMMVHPNDPLNTPEQVMQIIKLNYATLQLVSSNDLLGEGNFEGTVGGAAKEPAGEKEAAQQETTEKNEQEGVEENEEEELDGLTRQLVFSGFGEHYVQIVPVPEEAARIVVQKKEASGEGILLTHN